ncbi:carbamoyl-phosphate synthase (glutamine-hydrolyzing) large subunit [Candidatus Uhrbacteria bacterium]|nr:carbamoyl-phosphate synthase (glutamine-hydrolyzing) large subunit [Candidatus Uhrbacteria bacterium]
MIHSCKKMLVLGSGGLRIGQAGEFDYSGSQALKALREEGIITVLVNPNIATVQTDASMADIVYLQPLTLHVVSEIIHKERPDGLLLGFGGQTALNLGLELKRNNVLKKYRVAVYGTPLSAIEITEDRELFKRALQEIFIPTPKSYTAQSVKEAIEASRTIGFPVMMRTGFALGGLGSGVCYDEYSLEKYAKEALTASPQLLIEEYLGGWKEIEYEVVRDIADNVVTVCNMENMDPLGIHTGESIVVAPSQTLTNSEYHMLREVSIRIARHIGIVGECNIQYALDPRSEQYRVIEMNARLSRSSALASKATGYPLAFIATKLALGKRLDDLKNLITKTTSAFFEPALDYLVVKIPKWDIDKLKSAHHRIGTEMKSVGEVMAIGRNFPEGLQKAVRMLNGGQLELSHHPYRFADIEEEVGTPTDHRLFALYEYFKKKGSVERAHELSRIDPWFLQQIKNVADHEHSLAKKPLTAGFLRESKQYGFSDRQIAHARTLTEHQIRKMRIRFGIIPYVKQIDTLAGEFPAQTNYLYCTYHGTEHDISASGKQPIVVLGSGPYSIGSSVEFDWCAVNTARTARAMSEYTIIINSNPETVSTDYDESDRLYFEELTLERVQDILDFEHAKGVVVSVGGQIAQNLTMPLHKNHYPILGTTPSSIDMAEDRGKFSALLTKFGIDQPAWDRVTSIKKALEFAKGVGYPILVRPSYVLSGSAMNVVRSDVALKKYIQDAAVLSSDHPVVLSQFIMGAKELEIDGVAFRGKIIVQAISEHIENAGVHSGDATIVIPPQRLYMETIHKTKNIAKNIAKALRITGPFNIQFIAKNNDIKVIECNVRASRSFPFVSKVANVNFIELATKALLGIQSKGDYETLELNHVGVKQPLFSYSRLKGADPVASVEMASTGEVACIGDTILEAFYLSWLATEQNVTRKKILLSIGGEYSKAKLFENIKKLEAAGWEIYATEGTHHYLTQKGVGCIFVFKFSQGLSPNIADIITKHSIGLIINIPKGPRLGIETDGYHIRRFAIDHHIPVLTNLQTARILLNCLTDVSLESIPLRSWQEYMTRI